MKVMVIAVLLNLLFLPAAYARNYPVYRISQKPAIDGKIDDAVWQELPEAAGFFIFKGEGFAWQKPTSFRMGWDRDCLHIAVRCKEPFNHRIDALPRDGDMLWDDDSVEVFISPGGTSYCQFIVNSAGARWNGKDGDVPPGIWGWKAGADFYGDYWAAEMCIPFSVIGKTPREGDAWKLNVARNAILGPAAERYSSWAPVQRGFGEVPNFTKMVFMGVSAHQEVSAAEQMMNEPFYAFLKQAPHSLETPVKNRFFEDGLEYWGRREPHRISVDETTSTIGRQSIRLDGVLNPGEEPVFVYAAQSVSLKPGARYILRADIKRSKFSGVISVDVLERDSRDADWTYHRCGDRSQQGDIPGGWGRYEIRFKTSDNLLESQLMLYNIGSDAVAWYDNIQLFEDDGTAVDEVMPRAVKNLIFDLDARNASAKMFVNGAAVAATPGQPLSALIREGINVIAVDAAAQGTNPGVKIDMREHPETGGRWRISGRQEPAAVWVTANYDDRGWDKAAEDAGGFIWTADKGSERTLMRQVILWNQGHDGPDRCINPLVKEWGISEDSVETLFSAIYSPFAFPPEDYEFILDVPADFRLLDFMHEDGRHFLNTRPSGFVVEQVPHDGEQYTRYRIAFPKESMYAGETSIASRYLLLPVFLEKWTGKGETTAWYYRREAKGNFTELQQKIPVRILPPINGRMLKDIMISQYCARPWSSGASPHISSEHLERHLSQSFRAGFNTWVLPVYPWSNIDVDPYLKTIHDRAINEKNGKVVLWNNYPYHGTKQFYPEKFLYRWLEENPRGRARYWQDSDTWERMGQWCPSYALEEGREGFYREVLGNYRSGLEGLPGASVVWSDFEEAPWGADTIYVMPRDGKGSWCFCDRCRENFRRWAQLPADADLSDSNIFASYREKWHSFRSYQDGEIAAVAKQAANELNRQYMFYSWSAHKDLWAALKGNIDRVFIGDPGNPAADGYQQRGLDNNAVFLRDEAGFERSVIMGQRFSFFSHYAWLPTQDHQQFWKKWTVLSPTGYVEPKTWKSQFLRVVAAYGGGIDIQASIECSAGMLYWIGEATRIMAEYEDLFHRGERADTLAVCDKLAYPNVLVLKKDGERVVLMFNEGDNLIEAVLNNKEIMRGQTAVIYGTNIKTSNPSEMKVAIPARDVVVVHIR
ncbi:MAG: sugar-binding protein [Candidatus Omnitrophota bacterium]